MQSKTTMPVLPYPVFLIGKYATQAAEMTREADLKLQTLTAKEKPPVKQTELVEEKVKTATVTDEAIRNEIVSDKTRAESLGKDEVATEKALKEAALEESTRLIEAASISNIDDEDLEEIVPPPAIVEDTPIDEPTNRSLDMYT